MKLKTLVVLVLAVLVAGTAMLSYQQGRSDEKAGRETPWVAAAWAQQGEPLVSATASRAPRDAYFPNSETLGPDEMRITACGTGMPTGRESQAAACFLVELGNGDKFLFDSGTGSHVRVASLEIPYDFLDKIFISHLHTDHFGDFAAYYIGGWVAGRSVPLRVWGPSGPEPELAATGSGDSPREAESSRSTSSTTWVRTSSSTRRTGSRYARSRPSTALTVR
jgi:ribonuclease Z